jgi:hypothetical protein
VENKKTEQWSREGQEIDLTIAIRADVVRETIERADSFGDSFSAYVQMALNHFNQGAISIEHSNEQMQAAYERGFKLGAAGARMYREPIGG